MTDPRVVWIGAPRPCADGPRALSAAGFRVEMHAFVPWLAEPAPEVAILVLDDRLGPGLVGEVTARLPGTKVIAISERADDVAAALAAGAADALSPPTTGGELAARVLAWTRAQAQERQRRAAMAALIDRMRQMEARLAGLEWMNQQLRLGVEADELTGLGNRRSFMAQLAYWLDYAARYGGGLSLVMLDLDGMKALNERIGHAAGDTALLRVADAVRGSIRTVDRAVRLCSDEFAVVMPATRIADAAQVAERIRERIACLLLPDSARLSASLGVACVDDARELTGALTDDLVSRADAALFAAKRGGKNRVAVDGASETFAA
jgi:diguanylate cyclase (GGDEF)-like protein